MCVVPIISTKIISYENGDFMEKKEVFAQNLSWKKIFWLFIFGCFFGFLMETILTFLHTGQILSRKGVIYGPFNPVYGFGIAILTICLAKRQNILIIFVLSALLGGSFEFICSYLQEKLFGTISWDYSNHPFNIQGRTSLKYMIYWGFLGTIYIKLVYPLLSKSIEKIPIKIGNIITIIMLIFITIDCIVSIAAGLRQEERKDGIPAQNNIEKIIDKVYPDSRMDKIYENGKDAS